MNYKRIITSTILFAGVPAVAVFLAMQLIGFASQFDITSLLEQPTSNEPNENRVVVITENIEKKEIQTVVEQDSDIGRIPVGYVDPSFSETSVLKDDLGRISEAFQISDDLKPRVGFWLQVYSKYTSWFSIIHDTKHPWIIYRVVDSTDIYGGKGSPATKELRDRKNINMAENEVRNILLSLAKKKNYQKLTEQERSIFNKFQGIKGPRKSVFLGAAKGIRSQRGQKNYIRNGIIDGSKYIHEMEAIFARYDLPSELVRLPLVESSFNLRATSKVGASGIWQFMVGVGSQYLNVNQVVDERNSPLKATEAAAQLMLSNFQILKSWPLAVTAYNHGPGGLVKASKRLKTKDLSEMIQKHKSKSFGFASENFYSEFLAALYTEKYQDVIFGNLAKNPPLEMVEISLRRPETLERLMKVLTLTMEEIRLYNPDLKSRLSPTTLLPSGYVLHLPPSKKDLIQNYYRQAEDARILKKKRPRFTTAWLD